MFEIHETFLFPVMCVEIYPQYKNNYYHLSLFFQVTPKKTNELNLKPQQLHNTEYICKYIHIYTI